CGLLPRTTRPGPRLRTAFWSVASLPLRDTRESSTWSAAITECSVILSEASLRAKSKDPQLVESSAWVADPSQAQDDSQPVRTRNAWDAVLSPHPRKMNGRPPRGAQVLARWVSRSGRIATDQKAVRGRGPGRVVLGSKPQLATTKKLVRWATRATGQSSSSCLAFAEEQTS